MRYVYIFQVRFPISYIEHCSILKYNYLFALFDNLEKQFPCSFQSSSPQLRIFTQHYSIGLNTLWEQAASFIIWFQPFRNNMILFSTFFRFALKNFVREVQSIYFWELCQIFMQWKALVLPDHQQYIRLSFLD